MMDFNLNKTLLCSVLGIMTMITSLNSNVNSLECKEETPSESAVQLSTDWRLSEGRYPKNTAESEIQTGLATESSYTETSVFSETETEITTVTSVPETSVAVTSVPETSASDTETGQTSSAPAETSFLVSETSIPSNPVPASSAKDSSYLDSCAFVGDSIMEGFSAYGFLPENQVFASVGLNPYQLNTNAIQTYYGSVTALSAVLYAKPENLYIMMGMNGVAWDINNDMTSEIGTFIDNVKASLPSVNIYLMSVTPVSAEREAKASAADGKILNSQIDDFNSSLLSLANEKNIYYLDVNSYLKGSNGCLPSDVTSDGIHISKAVYEDILSYILSHTVS
ncbi:MAG TPA: hypothetical protein DCS38_03210 [Ruminococcus sp.]|nr:hypothetical protein [Ruminococcus sp.]HBN11129.1 hypothetical protein [Ruminococcus sp.]